MNIPYYTTKTASGATIETYLESMHGPGYLRISAPISVAELLESCNLSVLTAENAGAGLEVSQSEFERISGKTFVPGTGAWAVGSQELRCTAYYKSIHSAYFEVTEDVDGWSFVTAYAEVRQPGGPPVRVNLNVSFD